MRATFLAWADKPDSPRAVREIPWGHNLVLLEKLKDRQARLWYAEQTIQNGWSRAVLTVQIETRLHEWTGRAIHNFEQTLPSADSDLVGQTLKDPYVFDFLEIDRKARERQLVEHIQQFLLELGVGFAFVGRQVSLVVGNGELAP